MQWRNRRGGRAGCPQRLLTGKFLLTHREKRGKEKGKRGENWEEKNENCKREGGKVEMEVGKVIKSGEDLFFFFFLFFLSCFSLLKTTKICFGFTKMGISTGKKHFTPGKKSGKMTLPPQKNMPVTPLPSWINQSVRVGEWEWGPGEALNTMRCAMCHQKDPYLLTPIPPNDPLVYALPPIDPLSSVTQRPPISDLSPKDPQFLILSPKNPSF